jgi:hypothetical protein
MRGLVALALVTTLAAACHGTASGSATGRAVDGPFTVEISSAKREYASGEPIQVSATLTYTGLAASVTITHALQTIGFGVDGFLNGNVQPIWAQSCGLTDLQRGQPLTVPFAKSGATMTPDPAFNAFMADSVLRLPPGVWHLYAVGAFSEGGCGDPGRDIRAEIVITVT